MQGSTIMAVLKSTKLHYSSLSLETGFHCSTGSRDSGGSKKCGASPHCGPLKYGVPPQWQFPKVQGFTAVRPSKEQGPRPVQCVVLLQCGVPPHWRFLKVWGFQHIRDSQKCGTFTPVPPPPSAEQGPTTVRSKHATSPIHYTINV